MRVLLTRVYCSRICWLAPAGGVIKTAILVLAPAGEEARGGWRGLQETGAGQLILADLQQCRPHCEPRRGEPVAGTRRVRQYTTHKAILRASHLGLVKDKHVRQRSLLLSTRIGQLHLVAHVCRTSVQLLPQGTLQVLQVAALGTKALQQAVMMMCAQCFGSNAALSAKTLQQVVTVMCAQYSSSNADSGCSHEHSLQA